MTQKEIEDIVLKLERKVTALETQVSDMKTKIGFINKLSTLLDVNIKDLSKNDILQFDGDRWTNINMGNITAGGGSNIERLSLLTDVLLSNLANDQALVWDGVNSKWVNKTIQGGGSGSSIDATEMWKELGTEDKTKTNLIHPSHIYGDLSIGKLKCSNGMECVDGSSNLIVNTTGVKINGNTVASGNVEASGEITAYK